MRFSRSSTARCFLSTEILSVRLAAELYVKSFKLSPAEVSAAVRASCAGAKSSSTSCSGVSLARASCSSRKRSCLLYPQKRTCAVRLGMSATGQERTCRSTDSHRPSPEPHAARAPPRFGEISQIFRIGFRTRGFARNKLSFRRRPLMSGPSVNYAHGGGSERKHG